MNGNPLRERVHGSKISFPVQDDSAPLPVTVRRILCGVPETDTRAGIHPFGSFPFLSGGRPALYAEILLKPAPLSFCRSWQSVRNLFYTLVIITLSCEKSKYFLTFFCLKFFKIQRIKQRDRCCCTNTTLLACCEQQHKVWIIVTVQPIWTVTNHLNLHSKYIEHWSETWYNNCKNNG